MRYMETTFATLLRTIAPAFAIAALMFGALYIMLPHLADMSNAMRLGVMTAVGGTIYLALAWAFRLRALSEGVTLLRELLRRDK